MLILTLFTFIIFPAGSCYWVTTFAHAKPSYPTLEPTSYLYQMAATSLASMSTPTKYVVVVPSVTPTIWITPSSESAVTYGFTSVVYGLRLSFYDPHIGFYFPDKAAVNCSNWDIGVRDCLAKVNHQTDNYWLWYGKGAACPPAMPWHTVVRVISPPQLARDWVCIDTGGAIVDNWIDFMLRYPDQVWTGNNLDDFPWSSTVSVNLKAP